jgi:hypothetical protein
VPVHFFVGVHQQSPEDGVVMLDCPDSYDSCHWKQWRMLQWVGERGYDNTFFCDDDTYVVPDRLMACQNPGYTGCPCEIEPGVLMAHGGAGFLLNRDSLKFILAVSETNEIFRKTTFSDRLVGYLAYVAGVPLTPNYRFNLGKYANDKGFCNLIPTRYNSYITTHFVTPPLADLIHHHFKAGGPLPKNVYDMSFFGKKVVFAENMEGKWFYLLDNSGHGVGPFDLAHYAEAAALNQLAAL